MSKIEVSFLIKSMDSTVNFKTIGEYKNNRIKFNDPDKNNNYVILHRDTIEYYKKGNVDMRYEFKLNTKTKGSYTVYGNNFIFDIVTDEIIVEDNLVMIKYRLLQEDELVNDTILKINYYFLEEE